jgi:hypothetical protein
MTSILREARRKLEEDYRNGIERPVVEYNFLPNDEISKLIMGKTIVEAKASLPSYYEITSAEILPFIHDRRRIWVKLENDRIVKLQVG